MINRGKLISTIFVVSLFVLGLPAIVTAQAKYDPYGDYFGRDRDYRRDDRRYGDYDQRRLRESVKRLDNLSGDFRRHLDSVLDRSRYDASRREDRINAVARDFSNAADTLKDRYDDGRNLNRSSGEARRVLQLGSQLDAFMRRNQLGGRAESDWYRIRQDLQVVAYAYGFNFADFNTRDGRYNDDRDDRYDNDRDNQRRRTDRRYKWPWE